MTPDVGRADRTTGGVPTAPGGVAPLTIADELEHIAPGWTVSDLCRWPPDAFAFTAAVLADSGAYRCVVDPPGDAFWPPDRLAARGWEADLRASALSWAGWAADGAQPLETAPQPIPQLQDTIADALEHPLDRLDGTELWPTLAGLLTLHALADEAAAGAGFRTRTPFERAAASLLREHGSLARIPPTRARVLPKLRPPASGITLRSLSHHLALDRSEVEVRWLNAPAAANASDLGDRLTLLLVPHPNGVRARDFVPITGPLANMDERGYGFYEYEPEEQLDPEDLLELTADALRHVGAVDLVVLPEAAIDEGQLPAVQAALGDSGVPYLIAGVRRPRPSERAFGGNYAHFGAGSDWHAPPQHKHHRWCLDSNQVHQYHLGAALDPRRVWWEAIDVPRRCLTFVTVAGELTICPLVCEDLARPDPVTDVVRSIAPTLVVALLLDGPQLAARWPARYASVLADDPGCSVLTLTALGMTHRSQPPGRAPSRAIALWKDAHRGLQQITLAEGSRAVALTAHAREVHVPTADGRSGKRVRELVLSGIEQVD